MVTFRGITVDAYKSCYMKFQLLYAFHHTPFGRCLVAITDTDEEVAYLTFVDDDDETEALKDLKVKWPLTGLSEDTGRKTLTVLVKIFNPVGPQLRSVGVLMKGTEFQIKVWRSLTEIPQGMTITYEEVARMANCRAAIAAGSAISKNYVAYAVPCHRVVPKGIYARGCGNKYAWGMKRKNAILEYERQLSPF
ncbi:PREDICTED: uncharacterized protein LOC105567628 [Vollenhovia emeryi]|uniref:uncharacterized protein LOC105567628 n=1 Tax=Vollenhovia emeryi TaxID=411798 RepID=UPI0005F55A69|nr:PREDICTED: uncharacterized protein LOC105567628 [Vollenhovia emeryi]